MIPVLRTIAREVAASLVSEAIGDGSLGKLQEPTNQMVVRNQLRLNEIAGRRQSCLSRVTRSVRHLKESRQESILEDTNIQVNGKDPKVGMDKAEEKLNKVFNETSSDQEQSGTDIEKISLDDFDDVDIETIEKLEKKGFRVIYPNLKYRKPKYQNVSEVLKYVESDTGKGEGVKLVIMNFND